MCILWRISNWCTSSNPCSPAPTPPPFSNLELAVSYCCAVQLQHLDLPWPAELLQWAECAPMTDSEDGRLLFRGLRLRMGVTWGLADSRKPLNTGVLLGVVCCWVSCIFGIVCCWHRVF